MLQYNRQKTLILAFCVLFFESLNYPLIKITLNDVSPFFFLSVRFWLLAIIFMPFAKIKNVQMWPLFQFAIVFNVAHYGFNYLSFKYLSPTAIALFQYTQIPLLFLMIHRKIVTLCLSIMGVLLFISGSNTLSLLGCSLAIFSNIAWALGQMVQKKEEYSISTFVFFTSLFSAPFLSALAFFARENFNLTSTSPEKMIYLLLYQIIILGLCKGIWANLSFKEGRSVRTSFVWIFKPLCVAGLCLFL